MSAVASEEGHGEHDRPETARSHRRKARGPSPKSSAGEVVLGYIAEQVQLIVSSDPLVRIDSPGSVHRMRVATRRLRSCLQTFKPVLRAEVIAPLRNELKWLAGQLGAARDAEVIRDRMLTALDVEDHERPSSLRSTVDIDMSEAYRTAHEGLLRDLDSDRYRRILTDLQNLVHDPPLTARAKRPAHRVLPRRAARAYARLDALVTAAQREPASADRDAQWHEARKAAKKARYAGETLAASFGKPAARFAAAMEDVQEVLGEHQDSVVMRARVQGLAREDPGSSAAFAYGRLHAQEERRGDLAVERFESAWQKSKKKKLRAWFR